MLGKENWCTLNDAGNENQFHFVVCLIGNWTKLCLVTKTYKLIL